MEPEASMEMTDRHSGSSFRYDTYRVKKSFCGGNREAWNYLRLIKGPIF